MKVDKVTELELQELFAFEVFIHYSAWGVDSDLSTRSPLSESMFTWRSTPELRHIWRERAALLLGSMGSVGISIRSRKTSDIREALRQLMTIPERPAYTLGDE
jgi:hypothetical protein